MYKKVALILNFIGVIVILLLFLLDGSKKAYREDYLITEGVLILGFVNLIIIALAQQIRTFESAAIRRKTKKHWLKILDTLDKYFMTFFIFCFITCYVILFFYKIDYLEWIFVGMIFLSTNYVNISLSMTTYRVQVKRYKKKFFQKLDEM